MTIQGKDFALEIGFAPRLNFLSRAWFIAVSATKRHAHTAQEANEGFSEYCQVEGGDGG